MGLVKCLKGKQFYHKYITIVPSKEYNGRPMVKSSRLLRITTV